MLPALFGRRVPLPTRDELVLADSTLVYRIRESERRRTLSLELRVDGALTVAVPRGLRLSDIRAFVESRRAWIEAKRALLGQAATARPAFESGTRLPYLGGELTLIVQHQPATRALCRREQDTLIARTPGSEVVRRTVEAWYRRAAAAHAAGRIAHFAPLVGRTPRALTIRAQRTRWGSCTSRGTISLNWRLMQAAPAILDYVVVHELCHLVVPNHSPRFWAEVARVLPDFASRRAALRRFGRSLAF